MSYRAGSSGFAFPASWRTGAADNFCPSVSSCWRPLHNSPRRCLEAATQSPPQPGSALAVAAPWWSSRNSPLNRSAGDLLTGSLSLTLRSGHSVSNPQRATARGFHVCPCWWKPVPFGDKRVLSEANAPHPGFHARRCRRSRCRAMHSVPPLAAERQSQKSPYRLKTHRCRVRRKRHRPRSNAPIESAPAPSSRPCTGYMRRGTSD